MRRVFGWLVILLMTVSVPAARADSPAAAASPVAVTEARQAALNIFHILQRQDWVALYSIVALSEQGTAGMPTRAEVFAADVRQGIGKGQETVDRIFGGMSDMAVGAPDIQGDYATLATSCTITLNGQVHPFRGVVHLIRRQHAWKWDLTHSDDVEVATSTALGEMIGKPVAQN